MPHDNAEIVKGSERSSEQLQPQQEQIAPSVTEGMVEMPGFIDGKVRENIGEDLKGPSENKSSSAKGDSGVTPQGSAAQQAAKTSPPTVEVMRVQIARRIDQEIVVLEKEMKRIMRSKKASSHAELTTIVAKIRHLQGVLDKLAHATSAFIKNLWHEYVQRIAS